MESTKEASNVHQAVKPGLILAVVAVVQFMVSLDLSVVNVGLPEIAAGLGFSAVGLTWVIHAYALTFGGLLLLGGKLADLFGRKQILVFGLALFAIASLVGGFAQESWHLVAARAAQGVGAAALAPAALALLSATFPAGKERVKAFGIWSAMNAAGGALGVLIGGVLTQYAGWRWVMFISVPMAAIALFMALRVHSTPPTARNGRPDILGAVLATAGMSLLVFGVVRTEQHGWGSSTTLTTLGIAVAMLVAFVYVEKTTSRDPLIRLGMLSNRSVAGANIFNLVFGATMASSFYFVSLYLQRVLDTSPALTGVEFLPLAIGVVIGSVVAIKLGLKVPARTLIVVGGLVTAVGFFWFGMIDSNGSFLADAFGPSIITAIGFGLCLGPTVSTATVGVDPAETGSASGLLSSSRQIGASLGLAALGTAAQVRTGPISTPAALTDGYAWGLTLGAILLVAASAIALLVIPAVRPEPAKAVAAE